MKTTVIKAFLLLLAASLLLSLSACGKSGTLSDEEAEEMIRQLEKQEAALVEDLEKQSEIFDNFTGTNGIGNPWSECSNEDIRGHLGQAFTINDDYRNVTIRWNDVIGMAEMLYSYGDLDLNARMQAAAEFNDISGLYIEWDTVEDITVSLGDKTVPGTLSTAKTEEGIQQLMLCFSKDDGLMFSLSANGMLPLD